MPRTRKAVPKQRYVALDGKRLYVRKDENAAGAIARHIRQAKKDAIIASMKDGSSRRAAAGEAGIGRATLYVWMENDPAFARAVLQHDMHCIAKVERKNYAMALKDEGKSDRMFLLRTRGRYHDRTEISGPGGAPIQVNHKPDPKAAELDDLDGLTDAQLEAIAYPPTKNDDSAPADD